MLRLPPLLRRALVGAALWSLAAAAASGSEPGPVRGQVVIQLKWYDQFQFAGYYAAEQEGLYRAAGLDVTLRPGGRGLDPVREVLSGRAQFGIGDSDLLLARAKGAPLVVLAAVFQHSPYIILSRSNARLARPSDLVGKRVMALEDQGAAQIRAMLLKEGIDPAGVRLVRHSWDLQDLVQGRVDGMTAYLTVEPYQLQKLGVSPAVLR
ncbi:MAG TPA: ABC transporter substrate-binding protein, partial [Holophagaceae bacterium]|nr:ABC transporter substrate-binding protein [Holophagaceae bacterium]